MVKRQNLPTNNYNIDLLKSLDDAYFRKHGKWLAGVSPVGINEIRPTGYELYVTIKVYYPHKPYEFSLFFNEYSTDKEIQEELSMFKHLTSHFNYDII